MKHLYFWFLRKLNDGVPSRVECEWALSKHMPYSDGIAHAIKCYVAGLTLEQVADLLGVTRERIRQYLLKGCRDARKH